MRKRFLALLLLLALLLGACGEASDAPRASGGADSLLVHFIDVGQADCTLIECGGQYMLIDGGNKADGQLVVSYLEQQGVEELEAVVCTHAHEDHVGGLPSVLAVYPVKAVYAPTRTYASNIFDDFVYYTDQQGLEITLPVLGDTISLGGATATVLGPVKSYAETNDTSIVLRLDFGETSFLFTGDMEVAAENDMLDYWEGRPGLFDVDVLKVGHHGSDTSTGYRFLYEASPDYGVICVGAGNSYGHPHEEPLSRLKQAGVTLLRTDELGTILACSDGNQIQFTWANQLAQPQDVEPEEPAAESYIGNKNSQKFHSPDCTNLPAEKNRVDFSSYQEAIDAGYTPCGNCLG